MTEATTTLTRAGLERRLHDGLGIGLERDVGDTSLWQCVRGIAATGGLTAHVAFLPPIDSGAGIDRRHLAHRSHQAISHALRRASR